MSTPIERLSDEADLCRNEGADDIARLLDEAATALKPAKSTDQEREAFEAWARADTTLHMDRTVHGYADMTTELLWHAWQARAALAPSGEPVARPLVWDERDPSMLTDDSGFSIEFDKSEPDPELRYLAAWGEDDSEYFSTLEEAKAWCHGRLDAWVKKVAACQSTTPDRAERERCARIVEQYPEWLGPQAKKEIAAALRGNDEPMEIPDRAEVLRLADEYAEQRERVGLSFASPAATLQQMQADASRAALVKLLGGE